MTEMPNSRKMQKSGPPKEGARRYDLEILRSLRRVIRQTEIHSRWLASHHQITGPQLVCLLALAESGVATGSELAKSIHLSPSTVVGIIDRLEEKGLVLRRRSTNDRRRVKIEITAAGRELTDKAPSPLQQRLHRALLELPELEQATIALSLERIVSFMEAEELDAAPLIETGALDKPSNAANESQKSSNS